MAEPFRPEMIPQQPQRQDSLTNQLADLRIAAVRLGLYDAADYLAPEEYNRRV